MNRVKLFVLACVLGGAGGAVGSMVGHAFGGVGLWVGGIVGGLAAAALVARIAFWRGWIAAVEIWPTTIGTGVGLLLASAIAVNTLSSPIGPVLSTLLIGGGALLGAYRRGDRNVRDRAG